MREAMGIATRTKTKTQSDHGQQMAPVDLYGAHGREAYARHRLQPYSEEVTPAPEDVLEDRGIVGKRRATRTSPSILTVIQKSRGAGSNFTYWRKLLPAANALGENLCHRLHRIAEWLCSARGNGIMRPASLEVNDGPARPVPRRPVCGPSIPSTKTANQQQ